MFNFNVDGICDAYQKQNESLKPAALAGLQFLVESLQEDPDVSDLRWAAYMLATVHWECANRWRPIEEFGKGKGHPYGVPVKITGADGTIYTNTYDGRGYVQLTWKANYANIGAGLGLGNTLLLHPEHALEPRTAYEIMSYGMRNGSFTRKKLADYINATGCDYVNSRRIINGLDHALEIAGFAESLEQLLRDQMTPTADNMAAATRVA